MKKILNITFISFMTVFLVAGSVMAYPFIEVEGFVFPSHDPIWNDNLDGTTTINDVLYQFNVVSADFDAAMDGLNLEFEGDIFLSVSGLTFVQPTDWSSILVTSDSSNMYQITSGGTTVSAGDSLQFTVDVTLYTAALTSDSGDFDGNPLTIEDWTEGQIWGQSFFASDTLDGNDGGSTSIPEPATMLLLGTGLIGMAGFGRKKFK